MAGAPISKLFPHSLGTRMSVDLNKAGESTDIFLIELGSCGAIYSSDRLNGEDEVQVRHEPYCEGGH
jgi:hypothetical protein